MSEWKQCTWIEAANAFAAGTHDAEWRGEDTEWTGARFFGANNNYRVRKKSRTTMNSEIAEMDELDLLQKRPRFELRYRGKNHWVKKGSGSTGNEKGASGSGGGGYSPPPPAFDDYPIQPDYIPAPIDGFEDIPPPPPPPLNYDGSANGFPYNGNIDSGFGDPPPPPPPPPLFDDFN